VPVEKFQLPALPTFSTNNATVTVLQCHLKNKSQKQLSNYVTPL